MTFASERWRKLVRHSHGLSNPTNRRHLEVCVFSHLSSDSRSGDVSIEGSGAFADYRWQLLPWDECQALLPSYCDRIGMADNAQDFVAGLKTLLTDTAAEVDKEFPKNSGDFTIGSNGEPTVRRNTAREVPASAITLQAAIEARTVPRNLLDTLADIEHWTGFTRNFGPLSGDEPKLRNARERYLLTVFAMGCNLGPTQAARHLSNGVTLHQLSYSNQRHMGLEQLDNACRDRTEEHRRMMRIMQDMYAAGEIVTAADVEFMSPYGTFGVKRFGNYHLDMKRPPESWLKESRFKQAAKLAKEAAAKKKRNDQAEGAA